MSQHINQQHKRPNLPASLKTLPAEQQNDIENYASACVDHALHSVDRMLDAATHVVTFLPGWLINKLTPKYIHPMLSARTADKLTLKQAIKVSGALPASYMVDTAEFMPAPLTAEILLGLSDKNATNFMQHCCDNNPALSLKLAAELKKPDLNKKAGAKKLIRLIQITEEQAADLGEEALANWRTAFAA